MTAAPTPDTVLGTYVITVETHYTNFPNRFDTENVSVKVTACVITSVSLPAADKTHVVGAFTTTSWTFTTASAV